MSKCPYSDLLAGIDPRAEGFMDNPFEFYRLLRQAGPVWLEQATGIHFVGGYEAIAAAMQDQSHYSSAVDRPAMRVGGVPERVQQIRAKALPRVLTMTRNDDVASHQMFRSIVNEWFLPKRLASVEPFVVARTDVLIDEMRQHEIVDFVPSFSVPLPIAVITRQLGFDCSETKVKQWSDAIVDQIGLLTSEERAIQAAELELECHRYILDLCHRLRGAPGEGLASVVANARLADGRHLSDPELISMMSQMMVAGNETTTNALSAGMRRLAAEPALVQRLRQDPKLVARFVEEVLRLDAPVQGQFRTTIKEADIGGSRIPVGALLHLRFASANRDEAVYGEHAESLHLDGPSPRPHLAFGLGMHFCLGAMLSRLELRTAFARLLNAFETIELAIPDADLHHLTNFHLRGLRSLPLRLR